MADDLRRHLDGVPVHARPAGVIEITWSWCRRNPVPTSLLLAVTLGSVISMWHLSHLSQSLVRRSARDSTAQQADMMDELHDYYGDIVNHLKEKEQASQKSGEKEELASEILPAPATFTIEYGDRISERSKFGLRMRLYSDYPFKKRKDKGGGGPRDDFEREALVRLRENPSQPFYRFEDYQGRPSLRFAAARVMQPGCLSCHNNHAESTKHDWKEGDVRGVMSIVRPLDEDIARVQQGLHGTIILAGTISVGLLLVSVLILFWSNRRRKPL